MLIQFLQVITAEPEVDAQSSCIDSFKGEVHNYSDLGFKHPLHLSTYCLAIIPNKHRCLIPRVYSRPNLSGAVRRHIAEFMQRCI